jgi:hypothetical protein
MPEDHEETLVPDFVGKACGQPFIVAEVKRPQTDVPLRLKYSDILKTLCEMKLMLDRLIQHRVGDPEVIGIIFQGKITAIAESK